MADQLPSERLHVSGWYRITPRSFQNIELFFDPDQIILIFAGESYKSFLLRQDGRNQRAEEVGKEHAHLSREEILEDEQNKRIDVESLDEIAFASGSLLRKPKMKIESEGYQHTFYHSSRNHDVRELAQQLADRYSVPLFVDEEAVSRTAQ